jgi:hypothetical protein
MLPLQPRVLRHSRAAALMLVLPKFHEKKSRLQVQAAQFRQEGC